jgi:hypothetical protein
MPDPITIGCLFGAGRDAIVGALQPRDVKS